MSYINSNENRFYAALEASYGTAAGITAANRFPAVRIEAHQALQIGKRLDKTGTRTYLGSSPNARRKTAFSLTTYLTSLDWDRTAKLWPVGASRARRRAANRPPSHCCLHCKRYAGHHHPSTWTFGGNGYFERRRYTFCNGYHKSVGRRHQCSLRGGGRGQCPTDSGDYLSTFNRAPQCDALRLLGSGWKRREPHADGRGDGYF